MVPIGIWNEAQAMAGCDVIWFIDNTSALSSLVKGASSQTDICTIASVVALWAAKLGCRIWFEYVPSEANCSDGLSRDGLNDAWTILRSWDLFPAAIPPFCSLSSSVLSDFISVF